MSHTRVKTTYSVEGAYGSTETKTLYCHHNHGCDYTTFYDEDGSVTSMCFGEWVTGDDLWDAMNRLWFPYKGEWGRSELKDGVEHYVKAPWEVEK
jgi:hypothetical protein